MWWRLFGSISLQEKLFCLRWWMMLLRGFVWCLYCSCYFIPFSYPYTYRRCRVDAYARCRVDAYARCRVDARPKQNDFRAVFLSYHLVLHLSWQGRTQDIFSGGSRGKKCWLWPLYQPFISAFYLIRWDLRAFFTLLESFDISFNLEVYTKNLTLTVPGEVQLPPCPPPLCTANVSWYFDVYTAASRCRIELF